MIELYFQLFIQFFHIGVFSFGGGYATLPFLYDIAEKFNWFTTSQLSDMLAVSSVTPGPVGINMATFAGFKTLGIIGSVLATIALIIPSFFFVILISKLLYKFNENFWVKSVLYSLKPAGCGLLTAVGLGFIRDNIKCFPAVCLLLFLFIISFKFKKNPLYYFLFAAIIGILLQIIGIKFV